jgi:hypothetical protein
LGGWVKRGLRVVVTGDVTGIGREGRKEKHVGVGGRRHTR